MSPPPTSRDPLLEQRKAQLREISARRNVQLRELFALLRRRDDIGSMLPDSSESDETLDALMEQHDLEKHPETGFIAHLSQQQLNELIGTRYTGVQFGQSGTKRPFKHDPIDDDEPDELDLLASSSRKRQRTFGPESSSASINVPGELSGPPDLPQRRNVPQPQPLTLPLGPPETASPTAAMQLDGMDPSQATSPPPPHTPTRTPSAAQFAVPTPLQVPSISQMAATVNPAQLEGSQHWPAVIQTSTAEEQSALQAIASTETEFTYEGVTLPAFTVVPPPTLTQNQPVSVAPITFNPQYTLPPARSLPLEFKPKKASTSRKKRKEREKERPNGKRSAEDEFTPSSFAEWSATIRANPVWRRTARAAKCMMTKDWAVALSEVKLLRVFDKVEAEKDFGRWSGRQPKKQRSSVIKSHGDYLMDEMKWMRTDFREERRWKLLLAYNLSTSVLEWHAAGTTALRLQHGIVGPWKRPDPAEGTAKSEVMEVDAEKDEDMVDNKRSSSPQTLPSSTSGPAVSNSLGIDYGSDDEDEEDDKQSAVDAGEIAQMVQEETFEAPGPDVDASMMKESDLKQEPIEGILNLENGMEVDGEQAETKASVGLTPASTIIAPNGALKNSSQDPLMSMPPPPAETSANTSLDSSPATAPKPSSRQQPNPYAPLKEAILFSDADEEDALFISLEQLSLKVPEVKVEAPEQLNLSVIFPELHPYSLYDPDGEIMKKAKAERKAGREDPKIRVDELAVPKMHAASRFMHVKPTLLSSLQPAKRWRDGAWVDWNEGVPVHPSESLNSHTDTSSDIFDPNTSHSLHTAAAIHTMEKMPLRDKADKLASRLPPQWSDADDALLKNIIDRYPGTFNWPLIAELFNSGKASVSSDRRLPRDCFDRWKEKWQTETRMKYGMAPLEPATPQSAGGIQAQLNQMTTRKRLASASVSSQTAPPVFDSGDARKRIRHFQMEGIMKRVGKKRAENLQKAIHNPKKPASIHDSHSQVTQLRPLGPMELSRIKSSKEEENRQAIALRQAQQKAQQQAQAQAQQQAQAQANGQPAAQPGSQVPQAGAAAIPRQPAGAQQPQAQVNISGQQRVPSPANARAGSQGPSAPNPAGGASPQQRNMPAPNGMQGSPPHQYAHNPGQSPSPVPHVSPPRMAATVPPNVQHLQISPQGHPRPPSAQGQAGVPNNAAAPRNAYPTMTNMMPPQMVATHGNGQVSVTPQMAAAYLQQQYAQQQAAGQAHVPQQQQYSTEQLAIMARV
ncbi:hypothetical protein DL96DRAFT_477442 [Flagelloscypha sp. PMI_526]|nr:hypothetical protein DL96DRAFT_477442 [Flagelloscypha sp. PMI_526]